MPRDKCLMVRPLGRPECQSPISLPRTRSRLGCIGVRPADAWPPRLSPSLPGVDFLPTFARALLDGGVVPELSRRSDPLALARATIYVPTRRSGQALAAALKQAIGGRAAILPRILPLGAMESNEAPYFDESADDAPLPDLPQAVSAVERRLLLADLVLKWAEGVKHAIISVDEFGRRSRDPAEALVVATTPADAWSLAGDLAGLLDELIIEDVTWKSVTDAGAGEFDQYWRITTDFLDIAIGQWPEILGRARLCRSCDPAGRFRRAGDRTTASWRSTRTGDRARLDRHQQGDRAAARRNRASSAGRGRAAGLGSRYRRRSPGPKSRTRGPIAPKAALVIRRRR